VNSIKKSGLLKDKDKVEFDVMVGSREAGAVWADDAEAGTYEIKFMIARNN